MLGSATFVAGDYNGDGKTDVIITTANGSYEYTGLLGGGFTPNVWTRTDLTLGNVDYVPADFSGDGDDDLIVTTASGSYEYLGTTSGFTANVWQNNALTLNAVSYVAGAFDDIVNAGHLVNGLIVTSASGSSEYTGLVGGGFTTNVWQKTNLTLGTVNYFPGDFNGDGAEDIIITTGSGSYEYTGLKTNGFTPNVWVNNNLTVNNNLSMNGPGTTVEFF